MIHQFKRPNLILFYICHPNNNNNNNNRRHCPLTRLPLHCIFAYSIFMPYLGIYVCVMSFFLALKLIHLHEKGNKIAGKWEKSYISVEREVNCEREYLMRHLTRNGGKIPLHHHSYLTQAPGSGTRSLTRQTSVMIFAPLPRHIHLNRFSPSNCWVQKPDLGSSFTNASENNVKLYLELLITSTRFNQPQVQDL